MLNVKLMQTRGYVLVLDISSFLKKARWFTTGNYPQPVLIIHSHPWSDVPRSLIASETVIKGESFHRRLLRRLQCRSWPPLWEHCYFQVIKLEDLHLLS